MPGADQERLCFVIAPIGEEDSETRRRSDQVLKHVIALAAKECGYTALRADKISEPGLITPQIIQHLVEDPLVIADLTDWNPNVFYELAVRHAVRKPVVQIIQAGQRIPFDVAGTRTIELDHRDLDSAARCRDEIARQIRAVEKDVSQVDTPISVAIDLQSLRRSENPLEKSNAEIISMLQDLRAAVGDLADCVLPTRAPDRRALEDMAYLLAKVEESLTLEPGEEATSERLQRARRDLQRAMGVLDAAVELLPVRPSIQRRVYEQWLRQPLPESRK
jgi:hypothetical protein